MTRRVVITGLGLVTPFGENIDATWERLLTGERAVRVPVRHGADKPPTRVVGEVTEPDAGADPRGIFAAEAARQAVEQAGLPTDDESGLFHPRAGVFLGAGPGANRLEDVDRWLDAEGRFDTGRFAQELDRTQPESILRQAAEDPARGLARTYGMGGPVHAVTTACSASNQALGMAFRSIREGETDWCLTGGSDSQINPLGLVFFVLLGASANVDEKDPASACRPFDRRRSGLVMGEGAGIVVMEAEEHARARGAAILAEVAGYGSSLDAFRTTAPPRDGRGAEEAMRYALEDSGLERKQIDFVNAHGTGTKRNDPAEITAIKTLFQEHATDLAVSSSKGAFGHLLSAAAGVAFCCCVKAVMENAVPPTANLNEADASCDLDLVPDPGRHTQVRAAMNNSFAFGGQNACIIVKKYVPGGDA